MFKGSLQVSIANFWGNIHFLSNKLREVSLLKILICEVKRVLKQDIH